MADSDSVAKITVKTPKDKHTFDVNLQETVLEVLLLAYYLHFLILIFSLILMLILIVIVIIHLQ